MTNFIYFALPSLLSQLSMYKKEKERFICFSLSLFRFSALHFRFYASMDCTIRRNLYIIHMKYQSPYLVIHLLTTQLGQRWVSQIPWINYIDFLRIIHMYITSLVFYKMYVILSPHFFTSNFYLKISPRQNNIFRNLRSIYKYCF